MYVYIYMYIYRYIYIMYIHKYIHIYIGHSTPAFWKLFNRDGPTPRPELCFSVVTNVRTLDLAAETTKAAEEWKTALLALLVDMSPEGGANAIGLEKALRRGKPSWNAGDHGNTLHICVCV
jgi:hypothetical protein